MAEGNVRSAAVGVAEHGNSAVLVSIASDGALLDRRRVDLTGGGLPTHPYHHEGSWAVGRYRNTAWSGEVSLDEAIGLIERVQSAAISGARERLESLVRELPVPITCIAIRVCPELPPTIEERIADNRAQTVADSVMYREALADAARHMGWTVHWYDRERVFSEAANALEAHALEGGDINRVLLAMGRCVGPPWQARHKLAAAAAIAVGLAAPG